MLTFDTRGWQPVGERTWQNADGDLAAVHYHPVPPDLAAGLDRVADLIRGTASAAAAQGATLVELDVNTLAGLPAVRQLLKAPLPDRPGLTCVGAFTVPRADCSVVLRVQCQEQGLTGLREAVLFDRHLAARTAAGQPLEEALIHWNTGSLGSPVPLPNGGLPPHPGDDAPWDAEFPDHPLSRARALLRRLSASVRLDPALAARPPFAPPPPPAPAPARDRPRRFWPARPFR